MKKFLLVFMILTLVCVFACKPKAEAVSWCFGLDCPRQNNYGPSYMKMSERLGETAPTVPDIQLIPIQLSQYTDYIWRSDEQGGDGLATGGATTLINFIQGILTLDLVYTHMIGDKLNPDLWGPVTQADAIAALQKWILKDMTFPAGLSVQLGPGVLFNAKEGLDPAVDLHFKISYSFR